MSDNTNTHFILTPINYVSIAKTLILIGLYVKLYTMPLNFTERDTH